MKGTYTDNITTSRIVALEYYISDPLSIAYLPRFERIASAF